MISAGEFCHQQLAEGILGAGGQVTIIILQCFDNWSKYRYLVVYKQTGWTGGP